MGKLNRIDPPDCGCTDCLTGYSEPANEVSQKELKKLFKGKLRNATGMVVVRKVTYSLGYE